MRAKWSFAEREPVGIGMGPQHTDEEEGTFVVGGCMADSDGSICI